MKASGQGKNRGVKVRVGGGIRSEGRWTIAKVSMVRSSEYLDPRWGHKHLREAIQRERRSSKGDVWGYQCTLCHLHNSAIWSSEISGAYNFENHGKARVLLPECLSCLGLLTKLFVSEQQQAVNTASYLYIFNYFSPLTSSLFFSHFCFKKIQQEQQPSPYLAMAGAPLVTPSPSPELGGLL